MPSRNVSAKKTKLPPIDDFAGWVTELRSEYRKAKRRSAKRPRDKPLNVLKDRLYWYYRELKKHGLIGDLEEYILEKHAPWKGPHPGDAAWVVRLIESGNDWLLDESARNRMVADITLADSNDIKPEYLLAFLFEAGPVPARKTALQDEEAFEWAERYRR